MKIKHLTVLSVIAALILFSSGMAYAGQGGPERQAGTPGGPSGTEWQPDVCTNLLQDGSFEDGTPNSYWAEASTNFGTPICDAVCGTGGGTAGPRTGSWWAWFGGIGTTEVGSLTQSVTFPSGTARLYLYLWVGTDPTDASDIFQVRIDSTPVFTATGLQNPDYPAYTLVAVNLDAYANGASHSVQLYSATGADGLTTNFSVDDVALCGTAPASVSLVALDAAAAPAPAWPFAVAGVAAFGIVLGAYGLSRRTR